ncbi:aminotransferase class III-fold pyridoxal phosphate-dependent enzyme [Bosea sp. LjRoot9]|uniref:aminotransferase family protein n=1 Tax=Bosea sp. LjRoot9 TaxID=3342341 RepID=UPI003ECCE7FC
MASTKLNYRNDTLMLGFSDLKRLRSERPLVLTGGRGIRVFDERGRDYIEAVSSFYCVALGYSDEELIEAAIAQMRALPIYPSAIDRTVPAVMELAEKLAALSPMPQTHVTFATTGSEANDHLIKFIWYANGFSGEPRRRKIISRWSSYHGSTIQLTALGGGSDLHRSFAVPTDECLYVSHPNWPGGAEPGESEAAYGDRLAAELRSVIEQAGPETVAAFFAEPVSVSAGMYVPPVGYFTKMKAVLDAYGILLVADEVVTGFGRTGQFWGTQTLDIKPDCMTSSKALSSAYQPISAILMSGDFYDRLERGSTEKGWFAHGGTYHAHPVAAAVALKTIEIYERRNLVAHVRAIMPAWARGLAALKDHPLVAETRCFGLLGAVQLKQPGDGETVPASLRIGGLPAQVYQAGLEAGIIVRPLANCLVLSPPLIITVAEIDELFERLTRALDQVLKDMPAR